MVEGNKILIIGSNGMLAQAVRKLAPSGSRIVGVDLPDFDLTDSCQVNDVLSEIQPDIIFNCAAYTDVDGAEEHEEMATQINGAAVRTLAEAAHKIGAILIHISTDYVFSGEKSAPYCEDDVVGPISAYGRSKLAGEKSILNSALEKHYIVRTSWLYGPGGKNFVETIIRLAAEREELRVVVDQVGSPTFTEDLASALYRLLDNKAEFGVYHFSNNGFCSWYEFTEEIIAQLKGVVPDVKVRSVVPIKTEEYPLPATRPRYSAFSKRKYMSAVGNAPPAWQDALKRYFVLRNKIIKE